MYIRALQLRHFRSWSELDLELRSGITVLSGPNGHGKTNVVEAIDYVAHLSSHRVSTDAPLVREGHEQASVSATAINNGRELTAHLLIKARGANRGQINRAPCKSTRQLIGIVRTVVFSPEDLALVRGEPDHRRRFLDDLLIGRFPRWAGSRAEYDKILRQRNMLLKRTSKPLRHGYGGGTDSDSALDTLDTWDSQLAVAGAQVMVQRMVLTHILSPYVERAYQRLAPASRPAHMRYRSTIEDSLTQTGLTPEYIAGDVAEATAVIEAVLLAELARRRDTDIQRGTSTLGPHRDDVDLMLGTQLVRGYASHGESWSFALALRLASFEWQRQQGTDPILILDDVFAELDYARRRSLAAVARDAEQTLVTAAVGDDLPDDLLTGDVRVLSVEALTSDDSDIRCSRITHDSASEDGTCGHGDDASE
ncbi:DNA replication/repair protein RecF [Corynebacterium kroppenstedtii]|uniref:DNA replication/repair protein RecF n=1 Tax=Corynebacterium sp. PCR 32 TaxID=3351342 RepID=UPI0030A3928A